MKSDGELIRNISSELDWEPAIDAHRIHVFVSDGIATLSGSVRYLGEKWAAGRAALRVEGVRAVANQIGVESLIEDPRTDTQIAEEVTKSLEWHVQVPHNRVKVIVTQGIVTLEGSVDWRYQKDAAVESVRNLSGVKDVVDLIAITPPLTPLQVKEKIEGALERDAGVEEGSIVVQVHGDKVILAGTVHSLSEVEEAQRVAWSAPGIREVENNIAVRG